MITVQLHLKLPLMMMRETTWTSSNAQGYRQKWTDRLVNKNGTIALRTGLQVTSGPGGEKDKSKSRKRKTKTTSANKQVKSRPSKAQRVLEVITEEADSDVNVDGDMEMNALFDGLTDADFEQIDLL
jgi:hypothetical protein